MIRHTLIALMIAALSFACTATPPTAAPAPTPTPEPTPDIQSTVTAIVQGLPTATPLPTYTPLPALPTYTPYPTLEPLPTHTPYPTLSALPTATPYPTATPGPTYTPYPSATPLPTHTPYPTATPRPTYTPAPTPETLDNWLGERGAGYVASGLDSYGSSWSLKLFCAANTGKGAAILTAFEGIYADGSETKNEPLLVNVDGDTQEHTWTYYPEDEEYFEQFSALWPGQLVNRLLGAREMTVTIPTLEGAYVVSFAVAGLERHISTLADVCRPA